MALPKGVRSPIDYTKLYMSNELDGNSLNEKKEPKLPKTKSNVKSLNMMSIKPGEPISSRARGFINRLFGDLDTSREDKLSKNIVNQAKKSKNSASYRAMRDVAKGTAPRRGLAKLAAKAGKAISKTPKGALVAGGLIGAVAGARAIGRGINAIKDSRKKRRDAAIDKQVDKYVADRKTPGGPKKVNYMPDNMYTVKRDEKGKVTGTGDLIRVVPGTRTIKRMPEPGDNKKKSRFSQHTRMKLGNYGSLSPMDEATMTPAQKRKDTMLKKKYEKSDDMMDSFKDQYGKKKGKEVFYAFIRKKSMEEENIQEILDKKDIPHVKKLVGKLRKGSKTHAKQADDLEKAMKENVMLTYKSGQGFDAKIGNRSVRNTVSNIKTGVDAIKNIKKEGGLVSGIKKTINDKKNTNTKTDVSTNVSDAIKNFKMKENTAIESELKIQDWNIDDIKFTEIETVDIIKAKPLKESGQGGKPLGSTTQRGMSNFEKKLINNIGNYGGKGISIEGPNSTTRGGPNYSPIKPKTKDKDKLPKVKIKTLKDFEKEVMKVRTEQKSNWRDELDEDWQKVNRNDKTDGLSKKAVKAYRRENPGSKLQTAVTKDPKKLKKGSKDAKRRLSFCRRMKGMKKKLTSAKTRRDPDSRINKALRRWNC